MTRLQIILLTRCLVLAATIWIGVESLLIAPIALMMPPALLGGIITGDGCCTGTTFPSTLNVNFQYTLTADPARWAWFGPPNGDYAITGGAFSYTGSMAPYATAIQFYGPYDAGPPCVAGLYFACSAFPGGLTFAVPLSISCVPKHWLVTGWIKRISGVNTKSSNIVSGFNDCMVDLAGCSISSDTICDFELNLSFEITE